MLNGMLLFKLDNDLTANCIYTLRHLSIDLLYVVVVVFLYLTFTFHWAKSSSKLRT